MPYYIFSDSEEFSLIRLSPSEFERVTNGSQVTYKCSYQKEVISTAPTFPEIRAPGAKFEFDILFTSRKVYTRSCELDRAKWNAQPDSNNGTSVEFSTFNCPELESISMLVTYTNLELQHSSVYTLSMTGTFTAQDSMEYFKCRLIYPTGSVLTEMSELIFKNAGNILFSENKQNNDIMFVQKYTYQKKKISLIFTTPNSI